MLHQKKDFCGHIGSAMLVEVPQVSGFAELNRAPTITESLLCPRAVRLWEAAQAAALPGWPPPGSSVLCVPVGNC